MGQEFCSVAENASSYYCKAVEILGPVPVEFEMVYFIGFWIIIGMLVVVITSPLLFGNMIGGRGR